MPGTRSRSGRKAIAQLGRGDGLPEPPRTLSERAKVHWAYLVERLPEQVWSRIDGVLLASVAELLESQENISRALQADPTNPAMIRLRMNLHEKLKGASAVLGMSPRDRAIMNLVPDNEEADPFDELLTKMTGIADDD